MKRLSQISLFIAIFSCVYFVVPHFTYAADTRYYAEKVSPGDPMDRNFRAVTWPSYCDDSGGTLIDFRLGNSIGGDEYVNLPATITCTGSNIDWGMNGNEVTGSGTVYASMRPAGGGDWAYYITYYSTPGVGGGVWSTEAPPDPTCVSNPATRLVDFNPQNATTTSSPVDFDVTACISPEDVGTIKGVRISLHNIDQNVLLLNFLSPADQFLLYEDITTSGAFYYATTTFIADGNYRIEACLQRTYFSFFTDSIFSPISDCQSHQFIVGSSTFIGNISQTLYGETQDFWNGLNSTSSEALARTCNPLGDFDIRICITYLFIPDGNSINQLVKNAQASIFNRVPWGYLNRIYQIMNSSATSSLPSFSAPIPIGNGLNETYDTINFDVDMQDIVNGAGTQLDSIQDPISGKGIKDVFQPILQLIVALSVVWIIYHDITGHHGHHPYQSEKSNKKLS